MKQNNIFAFIFISLVSIALSGCMSVPPVPTDKYYQLPDVTLSYNGNSLDGILAVRRFKSDGLLNERAVLHADKQTAHRVEAYHYHFWSDTPPRMLQENLIKALRSTTIAQQVVSYTPQVTPTFLVVGKIRKFQQILGNKPGVIVEMELQLLSYGERKALLVKDYQAVIDTSSDTIDEAVEKLSAALGNIYNQFLADIARL
jgi:ABC-type uncharacterized transport system auxiliary subunit